MDNSIEVDGFVLSLPVWIVMSDSGDVVGGNESQGHSIAVFTEQVHAERYIAALSLKGCDPTCLLNEDAIAFFETLETHGHRVVSIDSKGAAGTYTTVLAVEKIIESLRQDG